MTPVLVDFTGHCPRCGKTLVYSQDDAFLRGPREMTCGGWRRHRWLVYFRQDVLGKMTPSKMRPLK